MAHATAFELGGQTFRPESSSGTGEPLSELALRVRRRSVALWGEPGAVDLVGGSREFLELLQKLAKAASFEEPVLIHGETGVGKELVARAVYLLSSRRGKPFVTVNCPQYQDGNLTVSELFGHKKGTFTGAAADRKGCFLTADGGVIFLDEINHLHMSAQLMLLRALGYGEFQPLGSDESLRVDVRVIAASLRSLEREVLEQHFRNDLFFRLRYFVLKVPPLRSRGEDWRLLLDYRLQRLFRRYGVRKRFSNASLRFLEHYEWPGNVRELMSVAAIGYAMAGGDQIEPEDFESLLADKAPKTATPLNDQYHRMVAGGASFWEAVHAPFLERDLNRQQVRQIIQRGLRESGSCYRTLLAKFNLDEGEYHKFMDFLRHHRLKS